MMIPPIILEKMQYQAIQCLIDEEYESDTDTVMEDSTPSQETTNTDTQNLLTQIQNMSHEDLISILY